MEKDQSVHRVQELIEQYNRQLMETYRKQTPPPQKSWLDEHFPLPDLQRDRAAVAAMASPQTPANEVPPTPAADAAPAPPQPEAADGDAPLGYLQVRVFAGNTAVPLAGARVVVTRPDGAENHLYANMTTDRDGLSPTVPLPATNPLETLQPGTPCRLVTYDIRVTVPGFVPILYESIPLYGGNKTTQPAAMIPVRADNNPVVPRVFRSGGPVDL